MSRSTRDAVYPGRSVGWKGVWAGSFNVWYDTDDRIVGVSSRRDATPLNEAPTVAASALQAPKGRAGDCQIKSFNRRDGSRLNAEMISTAKKGARAGMRRTRLILTVLILPIALEVQDPLQGHQIA